MKEGFVRNASLADINGALEAEFLKPDLLNITFTPLLLEIGSEKILIDTGFGDSGPPTSGKLRGNLEAAGITPDQITKVIVSHFHGDHINGLRAKDGTLIYPNAEVLVPEPEWAFWMDDGNLAKAPEGMQPAFQVPRRVFGGMGNSLSRYKWGQEIAPGVTAIDAKGHTPGHTAFTINSGADVMLMMVDVTNHPALFLRNPDWAAIFDIDPDEARKTRHRILGMAAADRLQIAGYHVPFPGTGHVVKDGQRFRFAPVQWLPAN